MTEIEAPGTIKVTIPDSLFDKAKKKPEEEEKKAAQPPTLDMAIARIDQLTSKVNELAESLKARREEEKYPCPEAKVEEKKPEKYPYKEEKAEKPKKDEEDKDEDKEEEKKAVKPKDEKEEDEEEEKKSEFDWEVVDLNAYETLKGKLPAGLRRWVEEHRKKKVEEKPEKYPYKEEAKADLEGVAAGDMIQMAMDAAAEKAIAKRLGEMPAQKRSTVPQKPLTFETPMDIPQEIFASADLPSLFKMGGYKVRGVSE